MRIALVTEDRYIDQALTSKVSAPSSNQWYLDNIFREDFLLTGSLAKFHCQTCRVSWSDPEVTWSDFDAVVIRTTWDYFERLPEFLNWLKAREADCNLINSPAQLRWNTDKHYLADLQKAGVRIVPTEYLERGTKPDLENVLSNLSGQLGVLKPCVSGAARHTYRLPSKDIARWQELIDQLLPCEALMVQPFQERILDDGEITLIAFNGRVSHAVRKRAKPGDFRVQDDHGGTVESYAPTKAEIDFAERALAECDPIPCYGRVDLVADRMGQLCVMELELIEPELWLRFLGNADAFAEAIYERIVN